MKRLKQLLVFCMVAVLAFSFTACGSGDETTLSSISVDYSAAKTEYYVYDEFSSDGIVVTANYSDDSTTTLTSSQYTIDSSAYDSTKSGTYAIVITYEDKTTSYNVTVVIAPATSLTLNTSAVTTTYYVGQTLSLSNLTATAAVADGTTKSLTYSDLTIDTSAVDMSAAGSYTVKASYTLGGATVSDEFVVTVKAQSEISTGLSVTKTTVEYTVESATGVTVSIDDLAVYMVEDDVVSTTALDSGSYELSYYKISDAGSIDVDNLTKINSLENLTVGRYEIWATVEYSVPGTTSTYDLSNCVVVYVLDEVSTLALSNSDTGTFTQTASPDDEMSSTWEYTLTYASGYTETIYGTDTHLSIDINTNTAATDATATVTYTKTDAKGNTKDVTCEVTYTITKAETAATKTVGISFENLVAGEYTAAYDASTVGTVSVDNASSFVSGATIVHTTTDKYSVKSVSETLTIDGESVAISKSFSTQGGSKTTRRTIAFTLAEGNYTITVYAKTSSTGRYVAYFKDSGSEVDNATEVSTSAVTAYTFENLTGGYYQIGGSANIDIYYILISSDASEEATSATVSFENLVAGEYTAAYDAATVGSITLNDTAGFVSGATIVHTTTDKYSVKSVSETLTVDGESVAVTKSFSTQGGSKTTRRTIAFTLAEGNYTITVYAKTSSTGRYVAYFKDKGSEIDNATEVSTSAVTAYTFENLTGGYYQIGGSANIDIYYIVITPVVSAS